MATGAALRPAGGRPALPRAPWIAAFAMSLAIHAGLLLWLAPTDDPDAELGRGAGSEVQGSVDAVAGEPIAVETMAVSDASPAPADEGAPAPPAGTVAAASSETIAPVSQGDSVPAVTEEVAAAASPVETVAAADPVDAMAPLSADVPPTEATEVPASLTRSEAPPAVDVVESPAVAAPVQPASTLAAPTLPAPTPLAPAQVEQPRKKTDRADEPPVKPDRRKQAPPKLRGAGAVDSQKGAAVANADSKAKDAGAGRARQAGEGAASWTSYEGSVRGRLQRAIRYPSSIRRGDVTGNPIVVFVIDAGGNAGGIALTQSSGNARIDAAALDAVRRASPFPPVPPELGTRRRIEVPLVFNRAR